MAYTLHWSNHVMDLYPSKTREGQEDVARRDQCQKYQTRIGSVTPAMTLTADVLKPSAEAFVQSQQQGRLEELAPTGCTGHRLDQEFPFQGRTPTCIPLVQYPRSLNPDETWEQVDLCAFPVLQWENCVKAVSQSTRSKSRDSVQPGRSGRTTKVSGATCNKYNDVPTEYVEDIWNYNYHHTGACNWVHDPLVETNRSLLVGNGSSLRVIKTAGSDFESSMLTLNVEEINDEADQTAQQPCHSRSSPSPSPHAILQISCHRKESLAVVRRSNSASLNLYYISERPEFLTTVPIVGYGLSKETASKCFSCDMNPFSASEVAAFDDKFCVKLHNFVHESSTITRKINREIQCRSLGTGLMYTSKPSILIYHYNNAAYFCDTREDPQSHVFSLLDFKDSFSKPQQGWISESISSLHGSKDTYYFYVGTTSNILLMDWRVPKHPVIKLSHGMKSPAAYIDTAYNEDFETVVAASQRCPELFCAVFDHSHTLCSERIDCLATNPVLASYPMHLSNSKDFFEETKSRGMVFGWQDDQARIENQCGAWCTGISVGVLPVEKIHNRQQLPGVFVISTNSFGDVFYQEMIGKPAAEEFMTRSHDTDWKHALRQWHDSMKARSISRPSTNSKQSEDCSIPIECSYSSVLTSKSVRKSQFTPITQNLVQVSDVVQTSKSTEEICDSLRKFKGEIAQRLLDVWDNDWKVRTSIGVSDEFGTVGTPLSEIDGILPEMQQLQDYSTFSRDIEIKQEVEDPSERYQVDASEVQFIEEVNRPPEFGTLTDTKSFDIFQEWDQSQGRNLDKTFFENTFLPSGMDEPFNSQSYEDDGGNNSRYSRLPSFPSTSFSGGKRKSGF